MPIYQNLSQDATPRFEKTLTQIASEVKPGGALKILNPIEYITDRQRRWYRGIVLPWMVKHDENQESTAWWDDEIKRLCNGLGLLKKQIFFMESTGGHKIPIGRLSISGVGKRNMTAFVEEILAMSVEKNWGIAPPDKELRK